MGPDKAVYDAVALRCAACEAIQSAGKEFHETGSSPAGIYIVAQERGSSG